MQPRKFITISLSHFVVDAYASIFSSLVAIVRMAPEQIGVLATISSVSSSFTQLFFGYLSDRGALHGLVVGGIVASAVFLAAMSLFVGEQTALFISVLILGGFGIAAFHPGAVVLASQTAGRLRGIGVSVFLMTGTLGFAIGPVLIEMYVRRWGVESLAYTAIPGLVVALAVWVILRGSIVAPPKPENRAKLTEARQFLAQYGGRILPIYILVVIRNMQQVTLVSFLQRMMVELGHSDQTAAQSHTYFIFGGAVGMFIVGVLMARYSRRVIQMISLLGGVACTMTFLLVEMPLPLAMAVLTAAGFLTLSTNSMHIVMGQEIAPAYASTVSSLMMGFGWGLGGIGPFIVGLLSPYMELPQALAVIAATPLLTVPFVFCLQSRPESSATDTQAT